MGLQPHLAFSSQALWDHIVHMDMRMNVASWTSYGSDHQGTDNTAVRADLDSPGTVVGSLKMKVCHEWPNPASGIGKVNILFKMATETPYICERYCSYVIRKLRRSKILLLTAQKRINTSSKSNYRVT